MTKKNPILKKVFSVIVVLFFIIDIANGQDSIILSKKQIKILDKKIKETDIIELGDFNSFASYLYAANIATIHTNYPEIGKTHLKKSNKTGTLITIRELFDNIAKQTNSKWSYDDKIDSWLFSKPISFEIDLATGWEKENRYGYIFFKPPTAPVGMDIYFADKPTSKEKDDDARMRIALQFAKGISPKITSDSMQEILLPNFKAIYYTTVFASSKTIWRQWAIVENGQSFVIVSAIKLNDDKDIFPDVEKMVRSFKVFDLKN